MSKKSAHVSNKMDLKVYVEGVVVEHILVHPNMVHLPRPGDMYTVTAAQTEVGETPHEVSRTVRQLAVLQVVMSHAVIRHRTDGSYSTELRQEANIFCTAANMESQA